MTPLISAVTTALSALTVLGNLIVLFLVGAWIFERREGAELPLARWFRDHALGVGFTAALIATLGSLFFSEIAGYTPCTLCWYQRILMYPQAIVFGMALFRRDRGVAPYALVLSLVGAVIALYHYYLQLGGNPLIPCSAVGYSVSCAQRFALTFGYITIPFMALSAFALILVAMLSANERRMTNNG